MNNKYYTVCGITEINGKILLVRHTYGAAKDRILLPGGFVCEGELPDRAAEREILEETGVAARARSVFAVQFKTEQWCVVFEMDYIGGEPKSDGHENSEVLLLTAAEALARADLTNLSRELIGAYIDRKSALAKSGYVPASSDRESYSLYEG
ncbi:MAG: NUDIX domain-containing protein [Lachnospiraceae bacterium]|nr:NUDIX domain-containing protein [Ruminococcus sp.]MCM1276074.1 NUDIX domain-containing protein [Lachnospiraceae bacterium]